MRCMCLVAALLCAGLVQAADNQKPGVAPDEAREGFVSLFDGKTLKGWVGDVKGYRIEHGTMVCRGENLFTDKEFSNFVLRFEFKLPPGGNNGVAIRAPVKGNAAYTAMEIQILDDGHEKYKGRLEPWQVHGSIYGVVPAKRGYLKPTGEWNQEEIVADGSHIKVTVNGTVVNDADLNKVKPIDEKQHPGLHNTKGHVGWLGHGDPVAFRNVRIKELP